METLWQDVKYGARMLVKNRGVTLVIVLTLGLGIGANTAFFSVVNAVLLRPLPFPEPQRLVALGELNPKLSPAPIGASFPNFNDWRDLNHVFECVAAFRGQRLTFAGGGEPRRIFGQSVSVDFFRVLGAEPLLGRTFHADEDAGEQKKVIILGYGFWQRYFGGDSAVLSRTIQLENRTYEVIGVMRPGFQFLQPADFWTPLEIPASLVQMRGARFLQVFARVKSSVSLAQARAGMSTLAQQLEKAYPGSNTGWGISVVPMQEKLVGDIRRALLILAAGVGFVLLIACANVANMLLARGATRQKEMAIRAALGAGRKRLIRQLLTETALLGLLGGTVGLLAASWLVPVLVAVSPRDIPRIDGVVLDTTAMGFTLLVSLVTGFLFGIIPAFQVSRLDANQALKEGASLQGRGLRLFGRFRLRSFLVITEVALALVLLVGAGLLGRSFLELMAVRPGFLPDHVLSMQLSLPSYRYAQAQQQADFYQQLMERVSGMPGVQAAGLTNVLPLSGNDSQQSFTVEGQASKVSEWAGLRVVSAEYFQTMGIPVLRGRPFTAQDKRGAPEVVLINEAMARRYWPNEDPVGKRILFGDSGDTIIGVVGNVKHAGLSAKVEPEIYIPFLQNPDSNMILVARITSEPMQQAAEFLGLIHNMDKELPVEQVRSMAEVVNSSVARPRFQMLLFAQFALLAFVLAISGIYGVVAYDVGQRRREIGIRMALGAQRGDVLRIILKGGLRLTLLGVGIGLAGSFAAAQVLQTMLYGVSPSDPLTLGGVTLLEILVAMLACYFPARRATKVDPMVALRYE
jgi:putative ABC transport system permease protein